MLLMYISLLRHIYGIVDCSIFVISEYCYLQIFVLCLIICSKLASCLIYARASIEYVCGCVLFQDVTVHEIHGR